MFQIVGDRRSTRLPQVSRWPSVIGLTACVAAGYMRRCNSVAQGTRQSTEACRLPPWGHTLSGRRCECVCAVAPSPAHAHAFPLPCAHLCFFFPPFTLPHTHCLRPERREREIESAAGLSQKLWCGTALCDHMRQVILDPPIVQETSISTARTLKLALLSLP